MKIAGTRFFEFFDKKQEAYEELKDYVLSKTPVIGDKRLKNLLDKERVASENFDKFLNENSKH